ncbi:uncharacterized protein LOC124171388 [Ischnura elegans]|uniref:uncharacterized protein LOC124153984 n=1 Tax=Ischnura elegans TaxID=197161 RepID=UPI001ED871DD|nr:uncharacterized protein LOC124153984 [Ischnura elegans]XP_046402319.1 uncharacterized protein LOC124168225 [Ischnura elegans]XP_046406514.1 uncharacterized protein LOC124171388 [Ischnura elegans]
MENDELLIDLVKNYPVLYDRSRKEFRDTSLKDRVWASIGEVLKASGQDCSSRWGTLRDRFVRELKADSSGLPSGSGAMPRRGWPLKEAMMWLQPFIRARKTFGNCRDPINSPLLTLSDSPELPPSPKPSLPLSSPTSFELTESSSPSSASLTIPVSAPSPDTISIGSPSPEHTPQSFSPSPDTFSLRKRKQGADLETALVSSLSGFSKYLSEKKAKKDEEDENDLFCRSLLSNLRRLSSKQQNQAKRKLLEVMYSFEDQ